MTEKLTHTILLARPGAAREGLSEGLRKAGLELALVADPLSVSEAEIRAVHARNLVVAVEPATEEALQKLESLLSDSSYQVLFEEAALVETRTGWDANRWSRHLGAKLLGHGNVLPAVDPSALLAEPVSSAAIPQVPQPEHVEPAPEPSQVAEPEMSVEQAASSWHSHAGAGWVSTHVELGYQAASTLGTDQAAESVTLDTAWSMPASNEESLPSDSPPVTASAVEPESLSPWQQEAEGESNTAMFSPEGIAAEREAATLVERMDMPEVMPPPLSSLATGIELAGEDSLETETSRQAFSLDEFALPDSDSNGELSLAMAGDAPNVGVYSGETEAKHEGIVGFELDIPVDEAASSFAMDDFSMPLAPTETLSTPSEEVSVEEAAKAAWTAFQNFDADSFDTFEPAVTAPANLSTGYQSALASEEVGVAPEQAYASAEEALSQLEAVDIPDDWQDFEKVEPPTESAPQPTEMPAAGAWSLVEESDAPAELPGTPATTAGNTLERFESRIASLSLVPNEEEASASDDALAGQVQTDEAALDLARTPLSNSAVVLLGGVGGPDPLRQILQHLPVDMTVPVLVQQWLENGHYDRLVLQMSRASRIPVALAEPGMPLQAGQAYVLPQGLGLARDAAVGLRFEATGSTGFADVLSPLVASASAVVALSGASEDCIKPILAFQQAGGRVLAQAAAGCYDHTVPALLITRGAYADTPAGLAIRIGDSRGADL